MHSVDVYTKTHNELSMDQFIHEYRPLVKKIALYLKRRLPSQVSFEDLIQSGFVGLLEARQQFKDNMGASFETYAGIRIRGAIIDSLRRNSWGTRESSRNMRLIAEAIAKIEQRDQKQATTDDIIAELGISPDEHMTICQQISISNVMSLEVIDADNEIFGEDESNPQHITEENDLKERIKATLEKLPEREKMVLSLYYLEEFTFKQIGEILDLTEARICQLHSQAIARMKGKLHPTK